MKKKLIPILLCAVLCVVVVVAIVIVRGTDVPETPEEETPDFGLTVTDEGIRVYRFSPVNVDYLQVENEHSSYRVRMKDSAVYIVGYESVPLLSASSTGLFRSVETLTLETVIRENCTDFSEFGLDQPKATITIRSYAGKEVTFYIGSPTLIGDYYYFGVKDDPNVYLIEKLVAERYLYSIEDYCDTKIFKTFETPDDFVALSVKSPTQTFSLRLATDAERAENMTYFNGIAMDLPFRWGADSNATTEIMESLTALKATSVARICVEEKDLAQYGLDAAHRTEIILTVNADPNPTTYQGTTNPYYDSTQTTGVKKEFSVIYYVGATVDGQTYVMFDSRAVVYTVPADTFYWLEWMPYRYCYKMLYGEYLTKMSSVSVETAEGSVTFDVNLNELSGKLSSITANGKTVVLEDFQTLYTDLLALYPVGEVPDGFEPTEPLLSVTYRLRDGGEHTLSFSAVDARNYGATVDGETHLTVRVSELENIMKSVRKLLAGQSLS